jgi:hypothetical protein
MKKLKNFFQKDSVATARVVNTPAGGANALAVVAVDAVAVVPRRSQPSGLIHIETCMRDGRMAIQAIHPAATIPLGTTANREGLAALFAGSREIQRDDLHACIIGTSQKSLSTFSG